MRNSGKLAQALAGRGNPLYAAETLRDVQNLVPHDRVDHLQPLSSDGLERLAVRRMPRAATLFEREGAEVVLGPTLRKLATAATFNPSLPYLSFLCISFDAPVVKEAASWFLGGVFLDHSSSYLERALEQMLDEADSPEAARFLRAVYMRIDGFRVEKAPEGRGQRVFVKHEVDGKGYELRLSDESAGTQKLIGLAAFCWRRSSAAATWWLTSWTPSCTRSSAVRDPAVQGLRGQQARRAAHLLVAGRVYHAKRRVPSRRDMVRGARRGGKSASCGRSPTSTRPTATWSARTRPSTSSTCRAATAPTRASPASRSGTSMAAKKARGWVTKGLDSDCFSTLARLVGFWKLFS